MAAPTYNLAEAALLGGLAPDRAGGLPDTAAELLTLEGLTRRLPPLPPPVCIVYGYEYDASGRPVAGRIVQARLEAPPVQAGGGLIEADPVQTVTGQDGYWELPLAVSARYVLIILDAGLVVEVSVPNATRATLASVLATA